MFCNKIKNSTTSVFSALGGFGVDGRDGLRTAPPPSKRSSQKAEGTGYPDCPSLVLFVRGGL